MQVQLKKGETDLDFKNYGLEIKVKFHDKDKLQALSSSIQSGGEKSVTTALYMMALQDMTQVHKRDITERASAHSTLTLGIQILRLLEFICKKKEIKKSFFHSYITQLFSADFLAHENVKHSSKVAHNS